MATALVKKAMIIASLTLKNTVPLITARNIATMKLEKAILRAALLVMLGLGTVSCEDEFIM